MVSGNVKRPTLVKGVVFGWGNLIFAEVLSLLVCLFTSMLMSNNIGKGIVGLFTMAILMCIIGNYAYNYAKNDRAYERTCNGTHRPNRHVLLSFLISLPLVLQWALLLVCKVSQSGVGDKVFVAYRLLNAYYLPWINVFCSTPELDKLPYMGLVTMLALTIIPAITFAVVYNVTYHNIDVEKIIMYNRD
jgi:hypothetical protein